MSSTTAIASSNQEPPSKKRRVIEPTSILQLPDELVFSCLALVSRLHYPILSLVSKTFRSLTASPELYQNRFLLNRTERCLYVCLQFPDEPNLRWFTLCRKADKTLNKKKKKKKKKTESSSSGNVLAPVQIPNSPPVEWSCLVAVGHKLYAVNKEDDVTCCSSNVFFLDCRTHTWVETPSLRLAHTNPKFDGMMYLPGGDENQDSLNCVEVLDAKTQTWKAVPEEKRIFREGDFQGKAYKSVDSAFRRSVHVTKLKDCTEDLVAFGSTCLIDKRLYYYLSSSGWFLWSTGDAYIRIWRKVEGLEELSKLARYSNVKLVECGGKMVMFWDKYVPVPGGHKEEMIWCAEISLEMRGSRNKEVWGTVEWFDAVLKVPKSSKFVYATAATL